MSKKPATALGCNFAISYCVTILLDSISRPLWPVSTTASGLQYEVLESGSGASPGPGPRSNVVTHYHGTLVDGTVFDSSVQRGEPAAFGVHQVIPAWTEALQMMSVGDKWRIACPPKLAYGEQGAGDAIPPNTALVFEIHLIDIKS